MFICEVRYEDGELKLILNSARNAHTIKRILEIDSSIPNTAVPADFVQVVRCSDCQFSSFVKHACMYECWKNEDKLFFPDHFCAEGKRRNDEEYSDEIKFNAVIDFLAGESTLEEIIKRYSLKDEDILYGWINRVVVGAAYRSCPEDKPKLSAKQLFSLLCNYPLNLSSFDIKTIEKIMDYETDMLLFDVGETETIVTCSDILTEHYPEQMSRERFLEIIRETEEKYVTIVPSESVEERKVIKDAFTELLTDALHDWDCDIQNDTASQIAEHLLDNGATLVANADVSVPGDEVWVIIYDNGIPVDIGCFMFVAETDGAIIVSRYINDYETFEETLSYHIDETYSNMETDLCVFATEHCFKTEADAKAALAERGAE